MTRDTSKCQEDDKEKGRVKTGRLKRSQFSTLFLSSENL